MPRELDLRLFVTPTLEIANIGTGDISGMSEAAQRAIASLQSVARRRTLAKDGKAMRDGSFPIPDVPHLKKAIQAYGRAKDKPKAKRFIVRRAKELGRTDLLPEAWGASPKKKAVTAAAQYHDGVMVAIYPPPEVAKALAGTGSEDEPAEELHVTLAYLGTTEDLTPEQINSAREVLQTLPTRTQSMDAKVQGIGSFIAPDGNNPHWYSVDVVGLAELRTDIVLALEAVGVAPRVDHDFTPHMTIRYGGEPLAEEIPSGGDTPWVCDKFCFVVGGERTDIPLKTASEPDTTSPSEYTMTATEFVKAPSPCSLDRSSKHNWVEDVGGLPNYICQVAQGIMKSGKSIDRAIPIAIGVMKNWAHGKGNVSAAVRARAAAALAEWDSKRARAKAKKNAAVEDVTLSSEDLAAIQFFTDQFDHALSTLDLEEGRTMPTETLTASAAAEWSDQFEYYWDPDADATYRVSGDTVEQFSNETWAPAELPVDSVRAFPAVDDQDTLETIVGAALADDQQTADVLPDESGRRFRIPIVVPEGVWSGDRRKFSKESLEFKEPPIPLLWQKQTDEGHKGSVTVGKITSIERMENGLGNAEGVFDIHPDAVEATRQVKDKYLTGVSGDVDQFKFEMSEDEDGQEALQIDHGRLVAATLVAKPAFQEATIELVAEDGEEPVIVASAGPLLPPKAWFDDPKLTEPTMLEVTDDGRVFGHIAEWNTPHTANPRLRPPRNFSNYKYFNRKPVRTAEGVDVRVGQLTLVGGHADLSLDPMNATKHYDDTRSAVADVTVGEDEFGIWAAGAMRPDVTPEQIRAFRASEPSGDWRMRDGAMELLACCQVNTAGFPIMPRALVASGEVVALVAAGMLSHDRKVTLAARVEELTTQVNTLLTDLELRKRAELQAEIEALRS
jgi:2'-5' RNA ligase